MKIHLTQTSPCLEWHPQIREQCLVMGIRDVSRDLRKSMTASEKILWERIRNKKLEGFKIRRQHPISFNYIVDFYCAEKKLIIEVDGDIHLTNEVKLNDELRTTNLESLGYKLIRFTNNEINQDIDSVLNQLKNQLNN